MAKAGRDVNRAKPGELILEQTTDDTVEVVEEATSFAVEESDEENVLRPVIDPKSGMWKIQWSKNGEVADNLKGLYTHFDHAKRVIDLYLRTKHGKTVRE